MNIKELLIQKAAEVRPNAHAPYSNFWVGAALITENGEIFCGVNFENASFGLHNGSNAHGDGFAWDIFLTKEITGSINSRDMI